MDHTSSQAEHDILIATLQDLLCRVQEGGRRTGEFALKVRGDGAQVINEPREETGASWATRAIAS